MSTESDIWTLLRAPGARVLLVAHQNPDGDTLGSVLALRFALEHFGVPTLPFCVDLPPTAYHFLPKIELFTKERAHVLAFSPTIVVVCDASDLAYAGVETLVGGLRQKAPALRLVVIDHHYTNKRFGDLNLVIDTSSSTAEIVSQLLRAGGVAFTPEIAQCILTGIVTDTGTFSNAATTREALLLASRLLEGGAKLSTIIEHTFRNKKISTLKLWGKILRELKETKDGAVVALITRADTDAFGVDDEGTEGIANFLQTLRDARMIVVIKELEDGKLKGSLRTTREDVDVSAIAKTYGGGGHKKAAGFTTTGKLVIDEQGWRVQQTPLSS
jgi:phosphoesterase RecJ-like protein